MSEPIHLEQVSAHTVAAIDPRLGSNAAAVVLEDFIVLVDAGMRPFAARLFKQTLEGRFRLPVKYACVTHYHHDHTFSLAGLKDVTLFASAQLAENMRTSPDWTPEAFERWRQGEEDGGQWLAEAEFIIPPLLFHGRLDILDKGSAVQFHHTGGHTSDSVYGYFPAEKVLFAADLLFSGRFPFAGDTGCDPEKWMAALRTWLTLDIEKVIPGHGPVADLQEVKRVLEFLETMKVNTLETIAAGGADIEIPLPDVYPVTEHAAWFAERTRIRWFEFYKMNPDHG